MGGGSLAVSKASFIVNHGEHGRGNNHISLLKKTSCHCLHCFFGVGLCCRRVLAGCFAKKSGKDNGKCQSNKGKNPTPNKEIHIKMFQEEINATVSCLLKHIRRNINLKVSHVII